MSINAPLFLALAEGFGLALSPCILPVLPFIVAAASGKNRARPFLIILGFIISFTIFSLVSRSLIALLHIQQDALQNGAYILLLLFGLTMLVPVLEDKFARLTGGFANRAEQLSAQKDQESWIGALLIGGLIGVVWTPCAGPILAAALLQIIQAQSDLQAFSTIALFSIGAGIPMLAVALFSQHLTKQIRFMARHATIIRRAMGVVIVGFALLGICGVNIGALVTPQTATEETASAPPTASTDNSKLENALETPYDAPEIAAGQQWFNSDPLTLAQLRGKVVLVDFWTYSCINCLRTLPYLKDWYAKYRDDGFVIIGVHAPEFPFEAEPDNVAKAIEKLGITYPVMLDNAFATWKNYQNKFWPAHYLIDRDGKVVYTHFGEGHYDITERNIRRLLGVTRAMPSMPTLAAATGKEQTQETYLGYIRAMNFASPEGEQKDQSAAYTYLPALEKHHWTLSGQWTAHKDHIVADKTGAGLRLHFSAGKVFLVLGTADSKPITIHVRILEQGAPANASADVRDETLTVDGHRLYELVRWDQVRDSTVEITTDQPGLEAYAFTFGI